MSALSDEIANDPLTRGYSGMTDAAVADSLNAVNGPHNPGRITRLGLYGSTRGLYGDFEGKSEGVVVEERTDQLGGKRGDEDTRRQVMRELEVVRAKNRMARELGISPDEVPATSEPDYSLELILLLSEA